MSKLLLSLLFTFLLGCNPSTSVKFNTAPKSNQISEQSDHGILGEKNAKEQLNEALKDKGQKYTFDTLIKNSATAVAIAEPILFEVYGRKQIIEERPYEIYLINGYWYISGTIPKGWKGGGFEMIFSAKDGKIIRLTHYK
ncbi:MAG TPA: YbbC/YhhH family protein [Hanamia sp.]